MANSSSRSAQLAKVGTAITMASSNPEPIIGLGGVHRQKAAKRI
jgi:hypothetical protein